MKKSDTNQLSQLTSFQALERATPPNNKLQSEIHVKEQNNMQSQNNIVFEFTSFENSFELQGNQHPSIIQANFQKYIRKVFEEKQPNIYVNKNIQNLGQNLSQLDRFQHLQTLLNNAPFTNKIFTAQEKNQFNIHLSRHSLLANTIQQLYMRYQQPLFLEFYRAILIIWKKFYYFAHKFSSNKDLKKQLPCIIEIEQIENILQERKATLPYASISQASILQESLRISPKTINELYSDSQLKFLNMDYYKPYISSNVELYKQFGAFIEILIKSVFLSSVQIFEHPDSLRKTKSNIKVEFQEPDFNWSSISGYNQTLQTDSFNSDSSHDF